MTRNNQPRILTVEPAALPADLAARTDVLPQSGPKRWEVILKRFGFRNLARRIKSAHRSWLLFRLAPSYAAVITVGDFEGLLFAWLQWLRRGQRPINVMYGCLWYGGSTPKRWWMRSCLRQVDACAVWSSVECERYARAYGVPVEKFVYVPHHHTLHHYTYTVGDKGYVFAGGNRDRDWQCFLKAVENLDVPCVIATNRPWQLDGLHVPPHVRVLNVTPSGFRQLMAEATVVVMPMRASLLHAGAHQTMLNAMLMGKPFILTDPAGGADYIENGVTGVLLPHNNVAALREAIHGLLSDHEKARAMGERARAAAASFTTERTNTMIWTAALQLAGERLPAAPASVSKEPEPNSGAAFPPVRAGR